MSQADRLARPLLRRAPMMARPARVRMRARKPCLRERRRLLGWKVRLGISHSTRLDNGAPTATDHRGRTRYVFGGMRTRRNRNPTRTRLIHSSQKGHTGQIAAHYDRRSGGLPDGRPRPSTSVYTAPPGACGKAPDHTPPEQVIPRWELHSCSSVHRLRRAMSSPEPCSRLRFAAAPTRLSTAVYKSVENWGFPVSHVRSRSCSRTTGLCSSNGQSASAS